MNYLRQQADAVPLPEPRTDLPTAYVGLTNQQLWDNYGVALSGEIVLLTTFNLPNLQGALIRIH
jgi:hypothetical protein